MKKLLVLLALLPTLLFAQTGSWVNFKVQYDYFAAQESNFFFVADANGDTAIFHQPTLPFEYLDTTININSGNYLLTLTDNYGDGWLSSSMNGWLKIENSCQGTILDLDAAQSFSILDTLVNILPCAPPIQGCTDIIATNYDSSATIDDGSCIYPPCSETLVITNGYIITQTNPLQIQLQWDWNNSPNPNCPNVTEVYWGSNINALNSYTLNNPAANDFAYNSNIGPQPAFSKTWYFYAVLSDSTTTDTLATSVNLGCLDPLATNYNPFAETDVPTMCQYGQQSSCPPGETLLQVQFTPDTYASESSWTIEDTSGNILATDPGYNVTGVEVITDVCIPNGTEILFKLNDSFGDGICGSCYGGVDGEVYVIAGCDTIFSITNATEANFGNLAEANTIIGPCQPISGCTDIGYVEFNPLAGVHDSSDCITPVILGCTDINSTNYSSSANTMEMIPTCNYTLRLLDGPGDGWFGTTVGVIQGDTSFGPYTLQSGFYQDIIIPVNSLEPVDIIFFVAGNSVNTIEQCGAQLIAPDGTITFSAGDGPWVNPVTVNQTFPFRYHTTPPACGSICIPIVNGCTDIVACNYDSSANVDNGTCITPIQYYDCNNQCIIDTDGDNVCDENEIVGCQDPLMFNYDPLATDSGACEQFVYGCMDATAFNYEPLANTDNGSCISMVYGCTDSTAYNYDPLANTDNGSCDPFVYGCTDPSALNYNPSANTDDFSCILPIYGCMDSTMYNYNPLANVDNDTCTPFVYGCNDATAFNYNPLANTSDNSCCYIGGCTDNTALNYNSVACYSDNSCIAIITGCTDVSAYNYDPLANVSDSTACLFDAGCTTGPGEPYWLNDPCYSWVIDVDNYCCNNAWDTYCQAQYDYCLEGWPVGLDDLEGRDSEIIIFPNPTDGYLYIATKLQLKIKLYDMKGCLISEGNDVIDMTNLPSGVYNLHIIYEGSTINHKVLKQ